MRVKYGSGYTLDCPEGEDVQELRRKLFSLEPTTYCPETPRRGSAIWPNTCSIRTAT